MIHRLCFIALTLVLSACVSVLPEQAVPDALYRIPAPGQTAQLSDDLLVHEPNAPRIFAGRAIASESSDGALRLIQGVEWADRSTRLMQSALIDAFANERGGKALSADGLGTARFELEWRLADFHLRGDTATCRVIASLYDANQRTVIARDTITTRVPVSGGGNSARISALKSAATKTLGKTAAFIADAQDAADGTGPEPVSAGASEMALASGR